MHLSNGSPAIGLASTWDITAQDGCLESSCRTNCPGILQDLGPGPGRFVVGVFHLEVEHDGHEERAVWFISGGDADDRVGELMADDQPVPTRPVQDHLTGIVIVSGTTPAFAWRNRDLLSAGVDHVPGKQIVNELLALFDGECLFVAVVGVLELVDLATLVVTEHAVSCEA